MATEDVPGANPVNGDELHAGCWAEHSDGSLIFVNGAENQQVVYSIFDMSKTPPVEYRDAMPEEGFKDTYTAAGWTWHDKTAFPWDRIMGQFSSGPAYSSADALLTAAERVAQSRKAQPRVVRQGDIAHNVDQELPPDANSIIQRIQNSIDQLRSRLR